MGLFPDHLPQFSLLRPCVHVCHSQKLYDKLGKCGEMVIGILMEVNMPMRRIPMAYFDNVFFHFFFRLLGFRSFWLFFVFFPLLFRSVSLCGVSLDFDRFWHFWLFGLQSIANCYCFKYRFLGCFVSSVVCPFLGLLGLTLFTVLGCSLAVRFADVAKTIAFYL